MYTGVVKFFDSRDNKRYGFIVVDGEPEDLFFHFNDGLKISAGQTDPEFIENSRMARDPQKGDRVVFKRGYGNKGPKAYPWGFESEYIAAQEAIAKRPKPLRYRVVHTFHVLVSDKPDETFVDWGGENGRSLEDLCARYPRDKHDDLRPFSDSDNIFDSSYQIQVNDGSGWKNVSADPRPEVYGFVRRRGY